MLKNGPLELGVLTLLILLLPPSWGLSTTQEAVLTVDYSTLFGGPGADNCDVVEVDATGAAYLGCHSDSDGLPGPGAPSVIRGDFDAFVVKLSADGRRIEYRTQLGGPEWDGVQGLAVGPNGEIHVVGTTYSPDLQTTSGAAQPRHAGGGDDAFVARLNHNGDVVYLTYLGGSGRDDAMGVALDGDGGVYVVGRTSSSDFPVSEDAVQPFLGGEGDAFLTKLDSSGNIIYSSFFGGAEDDDAQAVELSASGDVHIVGATRSPDFPLARATQPAHGGGSDGYVAVLSASGAELRFATFLGGSEDDELNSMSFDPRGGAYLAGLTRSDDLRVTPEAVQSSLAGGSDVLVARLEPSGPELTYLSYLGGLGDETRARVALDADGTGFLVGATSSDDFPLVNPRDSELGGRSSGFVAVFGGDPGALRVSTYFGGDGIDAFEGVAAHPDGGVVVTGLTGSADMPIVGGLGLEYAGGRGDIPVVRFEVAVRQPEQR